MAKPSDQVQLTVVGDPGTKLRILYRDRGDGDEPAPPLYEGQIGNDGSIVVTLPRCYCVVLADGYETGIANFTDGSNSMTVRLKRR